MLKRILFFSLIILAGCTNKPAPVETNVKNEPTSKPAPPVAKPAANPWKTGSYAPKEGETEGRKYVRLVTDGSFSDSTASKSYLYAEVIVNKANAGILLHEFKKTNPAQLFTEPVNILLVNSDGQELRMTSSRSWNSSGGIMIEGNNNDYSQFRIFILQSKGVMTVEIKDAGSKTYNFSFNSDGFSDSFSKI